MLLRSSPGSEKKGDPDCGQDSRFLGSCCLIGGGKVDEGELEDKVAAESFLAVVLVPVRLKTLFKSLDIVIVVVIEIEWLLGRHRHDQGILTCLVLAQMA